MDRNTTSRLGGILIEKGMITRAQLEIAVQEQARRRQSIDPSNKLDFQSTALGEILIDLGFITRLQLKRSLNWQMLLRKMTIAMSLVAPLMTLGSPTAFAAKPIKPDRSSSSSSLSSSSSSVNSLSSSSSSAPSSTSTTTSSTPSSSSSSSAPSSTSSTLSSSSSSVASTVSSSSTATTTAANLPLTIQAENYTDMYGVQTQTTYDTGGGLNVGWINDGDWISYAGTTFNAPATGVYKITYRVASESGGGSFALTEGDGSINYGRVTIPSTGNAQQFVDVIQTITMTQGVHSLKLDAMLRGVSGYNLNWFKVEYMGLAMPITIQAEDYDSMYGIETQTTTDTGGGLNVGWINDGDWMNYGNQVVAIPKTGTYKLTYRVATAGTGAILALRDPDTGTIFDTVSLPATGGFQTWVNVEKTISLSMGSQKFGILAVARGAGVNINWFKLEPIDTTSSTTSSASSSSAGTSTSSTPSSSSSSSAPSSVSSSSSSVTSSVSSSSSSAPSSVTSSSTSSTASSTSSSTSSVSGSVMLQWGIPNLRENGDYLDITEIGGYELRYKSSTATQYTYVTIDDAWQDQYTLNSLQGNYTFEVAVFDKNGLYSSFVKLTPL